MKKTLALMLALVVCLSLLPAAIAETAEKPVLTYYAAMNTNMQTISKLEENMVWQEIMKRFNVDIQFETPAIGSEKEAFSLMLASREFPDIIEYSWTSYSGGPEKAIKDEVIIDLTPYFNEQYMPNLYAFMQENDSIRKQVLTDNGVLYCFPCINISPYKSTAGYYLDAGKLKEYGKDTITTIGELDGFLRWAQEQGAEMPLGVTSSYVMSDAMAGAFGVGYNWYVDDGEIKFGPFEENYKAYIKQYATWYKDGLLDPDFVSLTAAELRSNFIDGKTLASYGYNGSGKQTTIDAAASAGKELDLSSVQYLYDSDLVDGPYFTSRNWDYSTNTSAAISVACKDVELACKILDYFYGEEGNVLKNFGIEGETYNVVDGKYSYSDYIMHNPDYGYRIMMAGLLRCDVAYPGFIVGEFHECTWTKEYDFEQARLLQVYNDVSSTHKLPQLTPTDEESSRLANITVNISTFMQENIVAMIMGQEDVDTFYDTFVNELRKMGAEEATQIYNDAYLRFQNR